MIIIIKICIFTNKFALEALIYHKLLVQSLKKSFMSTRTGIQTQTFTILLKPFTAEQRLVLHIDLSSPLSCYNDTSSITNSYQIESQCFTATEYVMSEC